MGKITKILDKLECISRIANHQRKRVLDSTKAEKMEILNDAIIIIERYLWEIRDEINNPKGINAVTG